MSEIVQQCQPDSEHTPTPWNCASRYSSVVGVPIVNQQGRRVGNTALPDMPPEWDHMKRQGEIDAAFICRAANAHDDMLEALKNVQKIIAEAAMTGFNWKDGDWTERLFFSQQKTSAAIKRASTDV